MADYLVVVESPAIKSSRQQVRNIVRETLFRI